MNLSLYICKICLGGFSSERKLSDHLRNLTMETKCYCSRCEKLFGSGSSCDDPIEVKKFYCNFCKVQLQFLQLKNHLCFHKEVKRKKYEKRKSVRLKKKADVKRLRKNIVECKETDAKIGTEKYVLEHDGELKATEVSSLCETIIDNDGIVDTAQEMCKDALSRLDPTSETDLCIFCSKEIPLSQLEKHENAHREDEKRRAKQHRNPIKKEGDIICTICGTTVPSKSVKKHERSHRRLGTVICTICGFPAKNIYQHMATHSDERKFACQECGLAFKHKKNLDTHMLVHDAVGKHSCPTCGKAFKTPYNLRVHMRSHQDIKPFACQCCEKTFTTKQSRDNHQKTHITHI